MRRSTTHFRTAIVAVLCLAAAHAARAQSLVIKSPTETVRIPTIATAGGPMIDIESLGRMIPVRLTRDSASWYTVEAWGGKLLLEAGSKIAVIGNEIRPLSAAPIARNRTLLVPLQVVSEVFPAALPNMKWEADSARLKLFTSVAGKASNVSSVAVRQSGDADDVVPRFVPPKRGALPPVPVKSAGRHMVIVDAGHGGVDNGMSGPIGGAPKIYEKNITLAVSKRLGKQLEARGVDVVYTRQADTLIALDDRGRIANRAQGDLFISIHVNAANPSWKDPGGSRGFETYFLSEARTEDARRVEQMENDAVRFEGVSSKIAKEDPLSFILSDMQQNEHLRESSELADIIQARLGRMHPGPSRGVKQAGFRVLVTAYMPAVLVEIGFGTNPREAQFIADPAKQEALAAAIADAAMDYLECYDNRVKSVRSNTCAATRSGVAPVAPVAPVGPRR
jgi:N-acetylmuramoyl-L-alanine amidase